MADEANNGAEGATGSDSGEKEYTVDDAKKFKEQKDRISGQYRGLQNEFEEFKKKYSGVDLDKYRAAEAERERLERELAAKDPQKLEEHLTKGWQVKEQGFNSRIQELEEALGKKDATIKTLTVTDKVMSVVGKLFNDDTHKFIKQEIERAADRDDDGQIIFKDEDGQIIYSKKNRSQYMGMEEFGQLLSDIYPTLSKSFATGGGKDVTPGQRTAGNKFRVPVDWNDLQSMPNATQVWEALTDDQRNAIAANTRIGGRSVR